MRGRINVGLTVEVNGIRTDKKLSDIQNWPQLLVLHISSPSCTHPCVIHHEPHPTLIWYCSHGAVMIRGVVVGVHSGTDIQKCLLGSSILYYFVEVDAWIIWRHHHSSDSLPWPAWLIYTLPPVLYLCLLLWSPPPRLYSRLGVVLYVGNVFTEVTPLGWHLSNMPLSPSS